MKEKKRYASELAWVNKLIKAVFNTRLGDKKSLNHTVEELVCTLGLFSFD